MATCWERLCDGLANVCCIPGFSGGSREERTRLTVKCKNRYASDENFLDSGCPSSAPGCSSSELPWNHLSVSQSGAWRPLPLSPAARHLSVSEAQLDRVQPPAAHMYRPDLAESTPSLRSEPLTEPETAPPQRSRLTSRSPSQSSVCDAVEQTESLESLCAQSDVPGGSMPNVAAVPRQRKKLVLVSKKLRRSRALLARESPLKPALGRHAQTVANISQLPIRELKKQNNSTSIGSSANGEMPAVMQPDNKPTEAGRHQDALETEATERTDVPDDDISDSDDEWGTVSMSTHSTADHRRLAVTLHAAYSLPPRGDLPYRAAAEVSVQPGGSHQRTEAAELDLSPQFPSSAQWELSLPSQGKQLAAAQLRVSVLEAERSGKDATIGQSLVPVRQLLFGDHQLQLQLLRAQQESAPRGQLLLQLHYTQERLTVCVPRARQLPDPADKRHSRPHTLLKATLRCGGLKVVTRRSAAVCAGSESPQYGAQFQFVLPRGWAEQASVVVTALRRGPLRPEAAVGRVTLGPHLRHQGGAAETHWGRALHTGQNIAQWHRLWL